jgi:uncharacterized protein (DUF1697 family)
MPRPTTYVAVLPGINVGSSKRIKMPDLRAAFEAGGATDVATYVQSGNVVFRATGARAKVVAALEAAIAEHCGEEVAVILRTTAELDAVVDGNPFADREDDPTKLHVVFLDRSPEGAGADLDLASFAPEELALGHRELYLLLPNGIGRAKLPPALARSKARVAGPATTRNWRSTLKLRDMARALDAD